MADRRMFAKDLVASDNFTDMSLSTQALYFHLSLQADDDGFVNNPKRIRTMIGASDDDLKHLVEKGYIIPFKAGIIVITHWKHNNYIRKDRYKPSPNPQRNELYVAPGGAYTLDSNSGIPMVNHRSTQNSIGENSIGENSIGENNIYDDDPSTRLDYDYITRQLDCVQRDIFSEVVKDIKDIYTTQSDVIWINTRESYPAGHVRKQYSQIDNDIVIAIIHKLADANIGTNARNYIRTVTYNTIISLNTGYNSDANNGR